MLWSVVFVDSGVGDDGAFTVRVRSREALIVILALFLGALGVGVGVGVQSARGAAIGELVIVVAALVGTGLLVLAIMAGMYWFSVDITVAPDALHVIRRGSRATTTSIDRGDSEAAMLDIHSRKRPRPRNSTAIRNAKIHTIRLAGRTVMSDISYRHQANRICNHLRPALDAVPASPIDSLGPIEDTTSELSD